MRPSRFVRAHLYIMYWHCCDTIKKNLKKYLTIMVIVSLRVRNIINKRRRPRTDGRPFRLMTRAALEKKPSAGRYRGSRPRRARWVQRRYSRSPPPRPPTRLIDCRTVRPPRPSIHHININT